MSKKCRTEHIQNRTNVETRCMSGASWPGIVHVLLFSELATQLVAVELLFSHGKRRWHNTNYRRHAHNVGRHQFNLTTFVRDQYLHKNSKSFEILNTAWRQIAQVFFRVLQDTLRVVTSFNSPKLVAPNRDSVAKRGMFTILVNIYIFSFKRLQCFSDAFLIVNQKVIVRRQVICEIKCSQFFVM